MCMKPPNVKFQEAVSRHSRTRALSSLFPIALLLGAGPFCHHDVSDIRGPWVSAATGKAGVAELGVKERPWNLPKAGPEGQKKTPVYA